jgi:hypothetical protein
VRCWAGAPTVHSVWRAIRAIFYNTNREQLFDNSAARPFSAREG